MTRGRAYSAATRAQVLAWILAGHSVSQAARMAGIDKATASRWAAADATVATVRNHERQVTDIGDQIVALIGAHVDSMCAQLTFVARDEYLRDQPAAALAELHKAHSDTLLRLLSGLRPAHEPEPLPPPSTAWNRAPEP